MASTFKIFPFNFHYLLPVLSNRVSRLDKFLFAFRPELDVERLTCEASLISRLGVARDLGERAMASDGLDLIDAATGIGD